MKTTCLMGIASTSRKHLQSTDNGELKFYPNAPIHTKKSPTVVAINVRCLPVYSHSRAYDQQPVD